MEITIKEGGAEKHFGDSKARRRSFSNTDKGTSGELGELDSMTKLVKEKNGYEMTYIYRQPRLNSIFV